jgi:hypothetical protein
MLRTFRKSTFNRGFRKNRRQRRWLPEMEPLVGRVAPRDVLDGEDGSNVVIQ